MLKKNFGENWSDVFPNFQKEPVGSGCIAQVIQVKDREISGSDSSGDHVYFHGWEVKAVVFRGPGWLEMQVFLKVNECAST